MSVARPADPPSWDLHFLTGLREGWLAVTDPDLRSGMALAFDPAIFNTVWLWGVYGGWRGIYTVAFEAWTSWPGRLDLAIDAGRHRTLPPASRSTRRSRTSPSRASARSTMSTPTGA
jgi:hypothetical protein